jgi:hypothetical protein
MTGLRAELNEALQAIEPTAPPVEAVIRRGRRLRFRRRLTALGAAAVAALVALGVAGYPALTQKSAPNASAPPGPRQAGVTVTTPFGSPEGVIATGTVGSQPWLLSVSDSRATGECFTGTVGNGSLGSVCDLAPRLASEPASWHLLSDGSNEALITGVPSDIMYVVVSTSGRQQFMLPAVTVDGRGDRYVGLVVPRGLNVTTGTAYLATGQRVASVRFSPPSMAEPGTSMNSPSLAKAGFRPGEGGGGHGWTATAEQAPWGTCVAASEGANRAVSCTTAAPLITLTALGVASTATGLPAIVYGSAQPGAASLTVTLTDGSSQKVPVVAVGSEHLWAFALDKGQAVKNWTAYSAANQPLGTGGPP